MFHDRTIDKIKNWTFMHAQENLNGTAALNQQDIHTQSHFTMKK